MAAELTIPEVRPYGTDDEPHITKRSNAPAIVAPDVDRPEADVSTWDQVVNFGQVAADEYTFGLTRLMNTGIFGTINAIGNVARGSARNMEEGTSDWDLIKGGFTNAYEDIDAELDKSREDLGIIGSLGAGLVGAIGPGAPAKAIDKGLAATADLTRKIAPKAWDKLKRTGKAAIAAGSTNMLQSYLQGETDFEDFMISGGMGAILGSVIQPTVGDFLAPKAIRATGDIFNTKKSSTGRVITDLVDKGADLSGFNQKTLAEAIERGKFRESGERGILSTEIGRYPISEQWRSMNDYMAGLSFHRQNIRSTNRKGGTKAEDFFNDFREAVDMFDRQVNQDAMNTVQFALDRPSGRYDYLVENSVSLKKAKEVMSIMSDMEIRPDGTKPLGLKPVKTGKFLDGLEEHLSTDYKRTNITELPLEVRQMYSRFNDLLRGVDAEDVGRDVSLIPIGGTRDAEVFADIPLAKLLDARRTLSGTLSPGMAFKNGTSPAQLAAGVKMLKYIDAFLDEQTVGAAGLARGAFAKARRVEEGYDMGKLFYSQRVSNLRDVEGFGKFYGQHVDQFMKNIKDPEVKKAVSAGFKEAMFEQTGKRSFLGEMKNFIGEYDPTVPEGGLRTKANNVATLRSIIGEKDSAAILDVYSKGTNLPEYTKILKETIKNKGLSPHQEALFIDKALQAARSQSSRRGKWYDIAGAVVRAIVKPADRTKAKALIKLYSAQGGPLEDILEGGIEASFGGFPMSVGAQTGAATGALTEPLSGPLAEYLKSVGVETD